MNNIRKTGYFENCNYLPTKLDYIEVNIFSFDETQFKTINKTGIKKNYTDDADVVGKEIFPTFGGSCNIYHCAPAAMNAIEARKKALFARKYGKNNYLKKYKFKSYNTLGYSRYLKWAKTWNNFESKTNA